LEKRNGPSSFLISSSYFEEFVDNRAMAFFQFGRKIELAKEYSLAEIPIFSSLTASEQKLIERKARLIEFRRGDIVYEEGTPAEAFYIVIAGRFRLFLKSKPSNPEQTLIYFYRGDHFGETSLLTGRPHSATVEAKRDGLILKLDKEDFLKIVKDIPAISLHLNRSLGHRLTRSLERETDRREVKIAALYSKMISPASFQFWIDLSGALATQTKRQVVLLDFVSEVHPLFKEEFQANESSFDLAKMEPSRDADLRSALIKHPKGFEYIHVVANDELKDEKKISTLITFLTYRFQYLMLRLPSEMSDFNFKALKRSDMVYLHVESDHEDLGHYADVVQEFQQNFGLAKSEIRVILPEEHNKNVPFEEKESILGHRIFSVLPSRLDQQDRYANTMRYLAKEFAGTLFGLALGSGAAYGLAHIGVLRVLEKEGIVPDIIAGSSIGALVGGLYGAGYGPDELEKLAKSIDLKSGFFKLLGFQDMSIAHRGFFKGHQVARFLESYLGKRTFQDLRIPVKIVAANLFTSEEVILDTGSLVDAIRASISIPGIFRPVPHQGATLIDGGVVDPLPVRVLASMGVKKIIAVNVLPGSKDRIERNKVREEIKQRELQDESKRSILTKFFSGGMDKVYNRYAVNIFNVIMSTIQFMEYEIAQSSGNHADILIHPIVREAHWAEFYSSEKFIKVGEEKTLEQMDEIKKLINE
jgi:predicted acylesterase/phospholipase RssA/CRP-like cAMP-binding protein